MNHDVLLNSAAEFNGVTVDQILNGSKRKKISKARWMVIWNAFHNGYSLHDTGFHLNMDHSSVCYAERKMGLKRKDAS